MIIFVDLTLISATEIPTRLLSWNPGGRVIGLFQFITGIWLMYCTYAITVDLALSAKAWIWRVATRDKFLTRTSCGHIPKKKR
jgi:hypothetical protein